MRPLSRAQAQVIEKSAGEIGSHAFEALTSKGSTWLIEVACSPESLLSAEVQRLAGHESAAIRCAHWNGCDLETRSGVRQVIGLINQHQPRHVWISTECGPFSPMQSINQRNEQQREDLATKRKHAIRQYLGASAIYQHCMQTGVHATWEWAQRCQAWRLPFMQRLDKKYVPYYAVTQGCQVGLKDPKSGRLMHKGWKLMTSHARMAEHMQLPCLCGAGQHHAKCEGQLATNSAFYTPNFVKRVAYVLQHEMSQKNLVREMEGQTSLLSLFGKGGECLCSEVQSHGSDHKCGWCVSREPEEMAGAQQEMSCVAMGSRLTSQMSDDEINKKLYLLHAATGHTSTRNMVAALAKRNAPKRVLELAGNFECAICREKGRIQPKHVASLETLPPALATVSADGGKWAHPESGEEVEFVCAIDEGSRYRIAKVLKRGSKQTMSAADFMRFMDEHWIQYFGNPHTLRLDPSGAFRSRELDRYCEEKGIYLDVIAGEAHWQLGTCEQAIRGIKEVMSKLAVDNPRASVEQLLSESVKVFNTRELVRGFSPLQHLMGRCPDETDRLVTGLAERGHEPIMEPASGALQRAVEIRQQAEIALSQWQAQQRLRRAFNSRPSTDHQYRPGDLVFYWRKQVSGKSMGKTGGFQGPARILAVETKPTEGGGQREGSAIWCVRGRRLLKCAAAQLRPASQREELVDHLSTETDQKAPWTFPRLVESLGGNEYEDLSGEVPDEHEWGDAQDPQQRIPVVSRRITMKRPAEAPIPDESKQRRGAPQRPIDVDQAEVAWWTQIEDEQFASSSERSWWTDAGLSVELAIDLPTSRRGQQEMVRNMGAYFMNQLKRRGVEISERHMSPADKEAFREAKAKEVRNFIAAQAFEALPPELRPSKDQATL